jgi:streptogramin lyase
MKSNRGLLSLLATLAITVKTEAATLVNFAGTGQGGTSGDGGPALQATLNEPFGMARGPEGALWFADYHAQVVRRIGRDGTISTVVGNGTGAYAGDNGPALEASLRNPHELRFDRAGTLFIADTGNHVIRRYDPKSKILTTVAGTGKLGYSGDDGPAIAADIREPISLQFSPSGDLFIADIGSHVIRRLDVRTGVITTFAGTGQPGPTPDGAPIRGTPLTGPRSLDFDAAGNLWLVTREGNQVLRLDLKRGVIELIAGTGKKGFTGDDGLAKAATFNGPKGIAVAPNGDVYVADTENHAIRRIAPKLGTLELVAGTGEKGDGPTGNPLQARLSRPHGIYVDRDGTVYIGDSENHRIRVIRSTDSSAPKE